MKQFEGTLVPHVEAQGANEGIQHSFRITTDAFAQGDNRLVNHRTYYFMAIAYGYNNYKISLDTGLGQDIQYKGQEEVLLVPSEFTLELLIFLHRNSTVLINTRLTAMEL